MLKRLARWILREEIGSLKRDLGNTYASYQDAASRMFDFKAMCDAKEKQILSLLDRIEELKMSQRGSNCQACQQLEESRRTAPKGFYLE